MPSKAKEPLLVSTSTVVETKGPFQNATKYPKTTHAIFKREAPQQLQKGGLDVAASFASPNIHHWLLLKICT